MNNLKSIVIIGLGLMGGSMALALKKKGYQGTIVGYDASSKNLAMALAVGAIDKSAGSLSDAIVNESLVIVAAPLGAYEQIFQEISDLLDGKDIIITDIGSVKSHIHNLAFKYLPATVPFIGGHPMTGSEKGGFMAATAHLFDNAYYFLTCPESANLDVAARLVDLVKLIGAAPVLITPTEHDRIVAQISHVPHLVAAALANTLDADGSVRNAAFVGGGFRDTTRIASGSPDLWKDIVIYNKCEILLALNRLEGMLNEIKNMISTESELRLRESLQKAKLIRDGLPKHRRDYLPALYDIIVDVEDRPGIIGQLTQVVGSHQVSIKEIEILHVRDNAKGAIRIGFATREEQAFAMHVLMNNNFSIACI